MKAIISQLRGAIMATAVLTFACCVFYPLAVFGIAQVLFPWQANGSLITDKSGIIRGSQLLGQGFTGREYFHPRPSAAGGGYEAVSSGGSNLGPTSQKLADVVSARIATYRQENALGENTPVPADAVTASGSGLDPHISIRNAELQMARVAAARKVAPDVLRKLIGQCTENGGLLGDSGINVLRLNLALDALPAGR